MSSKYVVQYILCCLLISWQVDLFAQFSEEQLQWLESEAEHPAQNINEGTLEFIPAAASKTEHEQLMRIVVTKETIASGWAVVKQCHRNLDRVEKLEIVFHRERVRNLQVTRYQNIEKAWSTGHRVIVRNVLSGSIICLRAESHVFHPAKPEGGYERFEMINGPFMRRFLDGFYPLTLSLDVSYPDDQLRLDAVHPKAQPGWKVRYDAGRIHMQGRFEGKLSTRLRFALKQ